MIPAEQGVEALPRFHAVKSLGDLLQQRQKHHFVVADCGQSLRTDAADVTQEAVSFRMDGGNHRRVWDAYHEYTHHVMLDQCDSAISLVLLQDVLRGGVEQS